jgi:polyphosphate kinase
MSEHAPRHDPQYWENLSAEQVLEVLVYELYNPVSLLGSHLNRITADEDPLTEEEYEDIFEQMQKAVRQLSKTVVHLRRYMQDRTDAE